MTIKQMGTKKVEKKCISVCNPIILLCFHSLDCALFLMLLLLLLLLILFQTDLIIIQN